MPRIRWTQASLRDVSRHFDFLSSKSRNAAKRAVKAIRQGVRILAVQPEIGRPIEDMPPEFREWIVEFGHGAYVVLHRFDGKEVVLLAIRHNRESGY